MLSQYPLEAERVTDPKQGLTDAVLYNLIARRGFSDTIPSLVGTSIQKMIQKETPSISVRTKDEGRR